MMQAYVGLMQKYGRQTLARQPEMDVVMYDQEQDQQFTKDGEEGSLAVLYQLIVDALLRLSPSTGRALDLGCGSGQLLCKIASQMPGMRFTGLDLSRNMLDFALRTARDYGVGNVDFMRGSWFELGDLESQSYDLVSWHLAMHHCDSKEGVARVIDDAFNLVKPGGTLFLFDIVRPKTGRLAVRLADMYSMKWGSWFYQDTLDSYKAAFTFDEMEEILQMSRLTDYEHIEPVFFNFWQAAFVSQRQGNARRSSSDLHRLWQKRDYLLLKLCFGDLT